MNNKDFLETYLSQHAKKSTVPKQEIESILKYATIKHLNGGRYIYHDGDKAECCFFVLDGEVELFKFDDLDHKRTHAILKPGDSFGVPELLEGTYQLNAQCTRDCYLAQLNRDNFYSHALKSEAFCLDVMKKMASIISLYQRSLSLKKAENRFYSYIYFLAKNGEKISANEIMIPKPTRYEDYANSTGLTRETVTRLLNSLKKIGIITINDTHFTIKDLSSLRKLAYYDDLLSGFYGTEKIN